MSRPAVSLPVLLSLALVGTAISAESRFAVTHSRSEYVHWIELYDAANRIIDVTQGSAAPYSPRTTCGRCHDYEAIVKGHHFNAMSQSSAAGRPGEAWIWTDPRTGTQLPLSYRDWPATYNPNLLGITPREFVLKFGRQLPGAGPGAPELKAEEAPGPPPAEGAAAAGDEQKTAPVPNARWQLSGLLDADCMICHSNDPAYSPETRWEQIESENFAWAPTAALGLAKVQGKVSALPDDFDPAAASSDSKTQLPQTTYGQLPVNSAGKVFLDIIRLPHSSSCYYCHTTHFVGQQAAPEWTYDEDVHLRAGISCADCHRNGIDHHTVRGFEGEQHPSGQDVSSLSCRGCHLDDMSGRGRLGAPKPLHQGLPALHLEKLSCTACHSGPRPAAQALQVQTAMAHGLGLPSHDYTAALPPGIVEPVMMRDGDVLYPYRMMWPAFWGCIQNDTIRPLNPDAVYDALRTTLRVRRGATLAETFGEVKLSNSEKAETLGEERAKVPDAELTAEEQAKLQKVQSTKVLAAWQEKLTAALKKLQQIIPVEGAQPVYVSGGEAYRLSREGTAEVFEHEAARPYSWKLAHDVRPARVPGNPRLLRMPRRWHTDFRGASDRFGRGPGGSTADPRHARTGRL